MDILYECVTLWKVLRREAAGQYDRHEKVWFTGKWCVWAQAVCGSASGSEGHVMTLCARERVRVRVRQREERERHMGRMRQRARQREREKRERDRGSARRDRERQESETEREERETEEGIEL